MTYNYLIDGDDDDDDDDEDDTVLPFYTFSNKKQQLKRRLDGVSNALYIPNGFPFGFQTHAVAYVS